MNGELFGRITDVPWAFVFPNGGDLPRHPSQHEAGLEGFLLIIVLGLMIRARLRDKPGLVSGVFLIGYAASRSFVELFREPDAHIGFIWDWFTMGQLFLP